MAKSAVAEKPVIEAPAREYEWPQPQVRTRKNRRPVRPRIPTARVIKVGYLDEFERFSEAEDGTKTVNIGQWRYPLNDSAKFDAQRMSAELKQHNLAPLSELFEDAPNFCQMLDCWREAPKGQAFCSKNHQDHVLAAHNRILTFE